MTAVTLGEQFASLHERFDVNTPAIDYILGTMGLEQGEIDTFKVSFEDRFVVSWIKRLNLGTFSVVAPGLGWTTPGEGGIHVTGLDDEGLPIHPNQRVYGHTVLHELGHVDLARRRPDARIGFRREERAADSFARRHNHLIDDLVDYEIDRFAVNEIAARLSEESSHFRAQMDAKHIKEAAQLLSPGLGCRHLASGFLAMLGRSTLNDDRCPHPQA